VENSKTIESIWADQFRKDRYALGHFFNVSQKQQAEIANAQA